MANFFKACKHGNIDRLKELIENDLVDEGHWEVGVVDGGYYNNLNVVKLMLEKGRKYIDIEDCFLTLFYHYREEGDISQKTIEYMREQVIQLYGEDSRKTLERIFKV